MKKRNTMKPREYILENLFWAVTAMIWYRNIFFVALPGITITCSKLLLWLAVLVFVAIGCAITLKKRRNNVSMIVNILLPYELYAVLTYNAYIPKLVWGSIIVSALLSIGFILLAITPDKQQTKSKARGFERHLKHGLLGARTIASVCMLILLVPLGVKLIFGHGIMSTTVTSVDSASKASEWTVKNNINTVRLLREDEWSTLDTQEKLDVLGVVLNIEIRYLGLNHELYLKSAILDTNTAAHYNHNNYEIVIDINHLQSASAEEILDSLCHECYHSYQYQMIALYNESPEKYRNMLLFQYVDDYIKEFSDYSDGKGNIGDYYFQTVEIAARKYAAQSVGEYYELIEEYTVSDG